MIKHSVPATPEWGLPTTISLMLMNNTLIIADSLQLSRALSRYIADLSRGILHTRCLAYETQSPLLSSDMYRKTDVFVLQLMREYPDGCRAEGVLAAEKLVQYGKRVLVFSSLLCAEALSCRLYWDLSSSDDIHTRIVSLLRQNLPSEVEIARIRDAFSASIFPVSSHHNN